MIRYYPKQTASMPLLKYYHAFQDTLTLRALISNEANALCQLLDTKRVLERRVQRLDPLQHGELRELRNEIFLFKRIDGILVLQLNRQQIQKVGRCDLGCNSGHLNVLVMSGLCDQVDGQSFDVNALLNG